MKSRIEKQIALKASQSRVWRALTDHQEFGTWFRVNLEAPFVAGHTTGGLITWPGYEHARMEIAVQQLQPEDLFSFTWHPYAMDPAVDYTKETPTLVTFTLAPTETGTLLTVTETGFENLPPERFADAFRMNTNGWAQQLTNIETYLTPAP